MGVRKPLANLRTGAFTSVAPALQPHARLENERLDLLATDPEHGRDLLVRLITELKQDERGALIGGQPLDVLDDLAQLLSTRDQARRAIDRETISAHPVAVRNLAARAQLRQTPVTRDRIQPWPQRTIAPPTTKRLVCRYERQLQRILTRLPASQHVHAETQQRRTVPVDNLLERLVVAGCDARHQQPLTEPARARRYG